MTYIDHSRTHLLVCIRKTRFLDGPPRLVVMRVQTPAHCPGGDDVGCSPVSPQLTGSGSSSTSNKTAQKMVLSHCRFPRPTWSGLVNHIPWVVSMPFDDCEYSWPRDAHSDADGVSWCSSLPSPDNPPPLVNSRFCHHCITPIWRKKRPEWKLEIWPCCFQLLNHSLKRNGSTQIDQISGRRSKVFYACVLWFWNDGRTTYYLFLCLKNLSKNFCPSLYHGWCERLKARISRVVG